MFNHGILWGFSGVPRYLEGATVLSRTRYPSLASPGARKQKHVPTNLEFSYSGDSSEQGSMPRPRSHCVPTPLARSSPECVVRLNFHDDWTDRPR